MHTFDLEHFNGPQTKFIGNSLYKHPVLDVRYLHDTAPHGSLQSAALKSAVLVNEPQRVTCNMTIIKS